MIRTSLAVVAGALVGLLVTAGILRLTFEVIRWRTAPKVFEIEYSVVYLTAVLGAGFGGLCGGLIGLSGVLGQRQERERSDSPPARQTPAPPADRGG